MKKYTDKQNKNILKEPATVYSKTPKEKKAVAPEGYMTHEEFWREADKRIKDICKQHGIL